MNKQAALERLTALENEAAALRKVIEQPENKGLWRPEAGSRYYYVSAEGEAESANNDEMDWDDGAINHGNCFPSREIAEKAAPLMARANKIIAAALQVDPDAGGWSKERCFSAMLQPSDNAEDVLEWAPISISYTQYDTRLVFVCSMEKAQAMADILNAEGVK
jgi:hypothetical protein